jgi:hypothetical protein
LQLADDQRLGVLEGPKGSFTTDGGEIFEELIQSLPSFQIVQQGLEQDARSSEDRRALKDIRVLAIMSFP